MKVFKFGGASVKDADGVKNVHQIASKYAQPGDVIVVSAMGKSTVHLEEIAFQHYNGSPVDDLVKNLVSFHEDIIGQLGLQQSDSLNQYEALKQHFVIDASSTHDYSRKQLADRMMAYGELFSTLIINAYLKSQGLDSNWVDIRNYITTDNAYGEAKIDWLITDSSVSQQFKSHANIQVTQGFLGKNMAGHTTTLGKEGSDFTAAIIASICEAESVTIWKDVPGVLTADPKLIKDTTLFEQLSYQEAAEMTYYGAKVIHPKTIRPLAQKNIPLFVRSFVTYDEPGTRISEAEASHRLTPSIIYKFNQVLVSFKVKDLSFIDERRLSLVFHTFDLLRIKINMIQNSAVTLSVCFDQDLERIEKLRETLKEEFDILYNDNLTLVTIKNYDEEAMNKVINEHEILLEQKSRHNIQILYRN